MSRSAWKEKFVSNFLYKTKFKKKKKKIIWSRNSAITANLIGQTVRVHSGKDFKNIHITKEKVGFKFGEFVFTRKNASKHEPEKKNKTPVKKLTPKAKKN